MRTSGDGARAHVPPRVATRHEWLVTSGELAGLQKCRQSYSAVHVRVGFGAVEEHRVESRAVVLVAHPAGERRDAIVASLTKYDVVLGESIEASLLVLTGRHVDVILAADALSDGSGLDLLRRCAEVAPHSLRLLLGSYEDLTEIVDARADETIARAIQNKTSVENIRWIVQDALGAASRRPDVSATNIRLNACDGETLLLATVRRLVRLKDAVLRTFSRDPAALRLEFVLPSDQLALLRQEVQRRWSQPIKEMGTNARLDEPLLQATLGETTREQEVYTRTLHDEPDTHAYLAVLPWRREPKMTVVVGISRARDAALWTTRLATIHEFAATQVPEFVIPLMQPNARPSGPPAASLLEYDWIKTSVYTGPDRRAAPTTLVNRYMFTGRRKRVPGRLARTFDNVVDRIAKPVRPYALAFVLFSTIDTVLTFVCVRRGTVSELNPVLRSLIFSHPWGFVALKYALSLFAFLMSSRFQLFRIGPYILGAAVFAYAALDLYWLVLLISLH